MANTDSHSEYCGMKTAKSNNQPVIEQWSSINWKIVEKTVWKLQTRIYSASRQGNIERTRQLQKTLLNSYYAKLLAVRRVTQENQGKRTAGVDGVKSLTPSERLELVGRLKLTGSCQPTRRVWIDKPGKAEKRPLSIPTILDRAVQALVKLAIEPEWEAVFEPNSFGFRPGRKAQDAIRQIKDSIKHKAKYVLDTDLEKCFDRINHTKLLDKAGYQGKIRRQLKAWLKSGVMDKEVFYQTKQGTPQGGICSPLLANIALHGMENLIKDEFPSTKSGAIVKSKIKYGSIIQKPSLIRYADDLVILCEDKRVVLKCQEILSQWLQELGLKLKPSKTRITHTLNKELSEDGKAGFDFLGYHIQQFPVSTYKQHTNAGKKILHKTFIVPSKQNQQQHLRKIKFTINKHKIARLRD